VDTSGWGAPRHGNTDLGIGQQVVAGVVDLALGNELVERVADHDHHVDRFAACQALGDGACGVAHGGAPRGDQLVPGAGLKAGREGPVGGGKATRAGHVDFIRADHRRHEWGQRQDGHAQGARGEQFRFHIVSFI